MEYHSFLSESLKIGHFKKNIYTSFRLLMELYSFLRCKRFKPSDGNVTRISVSLRSYIHSYTMWASIDGGIRSLVSVSLWSIIHSYSRDVLDRMKKVK